MRCKTIANLPALSAKCLQFGLSGTLLVSAMLFTGGCGPSRSQWPQTPDQKSKLAQDSCADTNLLVDAELSGSFLYKLTRCSSNQTGESQETLADVIALMDKVSIDGLDAFFDFLLQARPGGNQPEEVYPYLTIFNTVMSRGIEGEVVQDLNLYNQRYDSLQVFLTALDPERSLELIDQWQSSGRLNELLEEMHAFLSALDEGTISAFTAEMLAGTTIKPALLNTTLAVLHELDFMQATEDYLTPTDSLDWTRIEAPVRAACQANWMNPRLSGQQEASATDCMDSEQIQAVTANAATRNGLDRIDELQASLGSERLSKLASLMTNLLTRFGHVEAEQRLDLALRVHDTLQRYLQQNPRNITYLVSLLDYLQTTSAKDLDLLSQAAERLLDPLLSPTLNKFRAKIGASKLISQMEDWLLSGGATPGCPAFQFVGFAQAFAGDSPRLEETAELLNQLLRPQDQCFEQPPLSVAMFATLGIFVSPDCSSSNKPDHLQCVNFTLQAAPQALTEGFYQGIDSQSLKGLLSESLDEHIAALEQNPYALYSAGLAFDKVSPDILANMKQRIASYDSLTVSDIAAWDIEIHHDPDLAETLHSDFFERLLHRKIKRLAATAAQFNNILPTLEDDDPRIEMKAAKIFAGTYTNGPLEAQLRSLFWSLLQQVPKNDAAQAVFEQYPHLFYGYFDRILDADVIFKNPAYDQYAEESVRLTIPGSDPFNYLAINNNQTLSLKADGMSRLVDSLLASQSETDSYWGRWSKFFANSHLITKDIPAEYADGFKQWSELYLNYFFQEASILTSILTDKAYETQTLNPAYFNKRSYTPTESRKLAFYFLQNIAKTEKRLPNFDVTITSKNSPFVDATPFSGFFNLSYLNNLRTGSAVPWLTFATTFPETLSRDAQTVTELKSGLLPSYEELGSSPLYQPKAVAPNLSLAQIRSSFSESIYTLSALNMLTFTGTNRGLRRVIAQPVIGYNSQVCVGSSSNSPGKCPMEIQADGTTDDPELYGRYRQYVVDQLDPILCPLLQSDRWGPAQAWQQRLQLRYEADGSGICAAYQSKNGQWQTRSGDYQYPDWMTRAILDDIFAMGFNPELKAELLAIPSLLRWYKSVSLKDEKLGATQQARRYLRSTLLNFGDQDAARSLRRESTAKLLWNGSPTMLLDYLNFLRQDGLMAFEGKDYDEDLDIDLNDWLIKFAITDAQGQESEPLIELLTTFVSTQKRLANDGASSLAFLLEISQTIASKPSLLQTAVHSFVHFNSLESYDFNTLDLPRAISALFQEDFDWQDRGIFLVKQLGLQHNLYGLERLNDHFSAQELSDLLLVLAEEQKRLGTIDEQLAIVKPILRYFVDSQLALQGQEGFLISRSSNDLVQTFFHSDFGEDFPQYFSRLFDAFETPLLTLQGLTGPSAQRILAQFLHQAFEHLPRLARLHLEATADQSKDELFWTSMALDWVEPIKDNPGAGIAMRDFLALDQLGLSSRNPLMMQTLGSEEHRARLVAALKASSRAEHQDWQAAFQQSADLLESLQRFLGFVDRKIIWHDKSQELRQGLTHLRRLSENPEGILDKQVDVLQLWFDGTPLKLRPWQPPPNTNDRLLLFP